MGFLSYQNRDFDMDDRTLAHLHVVIINKLRHGESFALSWRDTRSVGGGRTSVWISPTSDLVFHYDGSRTPALNREWLSRLARSADSPRGLIVAREDDAMPALQPAS
ncbi:ATP-dependent DNA ligase [Leifsonia poae]|uniref:DUF7882 family protein n=1 Tax=Leifsonia poae TaxID=110933 RepID=UPI003D685F8E